MANIFNITILTREKTLYDGEAISLVAPGAIGYLGVLANHAPLITSLTPGKVTLRKKSNDTTVFQSKGNGFLHVLKNNVSVLLDTVETQ